MDIDLLYMRVAYAALLFIFVFCGMLRCFDFWKTLGRNADDLYPARRIVACIYFSVVLLLPCALHPQKTDAQLLARCFWVLFIPAATALGYKRFFFGDRFHKRLRIALVGGVPVAFTLALSCIALAGRDGLMPHKKAVIHAAGILGALLTAYEIHVMIWLWHIRTGADAAARAADKLFPKNFALGMLGVSSLVLVATWAIFLLGGVFANSVFAGLIAFVGLGILFVILHPQRVEKGDNGKNAVPATVAATSNGDTVQIATPDKEQPDEETMQTEADDEFPAADACNMEDEDAGDEEGEALQETARPKGKKYTLSDAQLDSMERQIRKFVEGKRLYLDPKLTRKTLEKKLGVNHFYLSEVFTRRFGSFNLYLNTLRMEQAIRYSAEHPDAKQMEVLHHSGFGSNNSYYRAKRAYSAENLLSKSVERDKSFDSSGLRS